MNISAASLSPQKQEELSTRKSLFDKMRDIRVKKDSCQNLEEVIQSRDFRRAFSKVLILHPEYNKRSIMDTLAKIRDHQFISDKDQEELLTCISDPDFALTAKQTQNKLKGFAARAAYNFLTQYPVSEILKHLKGYIKDEIKETFVASQDPNTIELPDNETSLSPKEYTIEIVRNIHGKQYILASMDKGGTKKRTCKEHGSLFYADDFVYDQIESVLEFGETKDLILSRVRIGTQRAYRSFEQIESKEQIIDEDTLFDDANYIKKIGNQLVYEGSLVDKNGKTKKGYIKLGKEKETRENIKFDRIESVEEKHGRYFYTGTIGSKRGYMDLNQEVKKQDLARLSVYIDELELDKNGNICYTYSKTNGIRAKLLKKKYIFKEETEAPKTENIEKEIIESDIEEVPEEIPEISDPTIKEDIEEKINQEKENREKKLQERKDRQARIKQREQATTTAVVNEEEIDNFVSDIIERITK